MALNIFIGVSGSGKTYFIRENFPTWAYFSVGDYQKKILAAMGNPKSIEFHKYMEVLTKANEQIMEDVVDALKEGKDVALEHTLYKRKRRLPYLEAFKSVADVPIIIYVLMPSEEQFRRNLKSSEDHDVSDFQGLWSEMDAIEFPNIAEGYSKIFLVRDGDVREMHTVADMTLIEQAKQELADETVKEMEKKKNAEEHRQLIQGLNEKGFWHYCECCGQTKFMTPQEAFDQGWDYPPKMGVYGVISPRTCGKCSITDTVWWKLNMNKEQKVALEDLSDKEKKVINRIIFEPYSLLEKWDV